MSSMERSSDSRSKRYKYENSSHHDSHHDYDDHHHHHSHRYNGHSHRKERSRSRSRSHSNDYYRKQLDKKYENKDNIINYKEKIRDFKDIKDINQAKETSKSINSLAISEEEERKKRRAKANLIALLQNEEKMKNSKVNSNNVANNLINESKKNNQMELDYGREKRIDQVPGIKSNTVLSKSNEIIYDGNQINNQYNTLGSYPILLGNIPVLDKKTYDLNKENAYTNIISNNLKTKVDSNIPNKVDKVESEEIDPLEEYMKTIEKDATAQEDQAPQSNSIENDIEIDSDPKVDSQPKIITFDDIKIENDELSKPKDNTTTEDNINISNPQNEQDEETFHKNFLSTINNLVNPNYNSSLTPAQNNNESDIIYQEDDVAEYIYNNTDSNEDQWRKMKMSMEKGKELKPVNHSEINYEYFTKNLYIEPAEIANMSNEDVAKFREENGNIRVRGKNIPKPIFNWYHCGLNSTITQILKERDIIKPFPIQMQSIPCIMSGRDLIGIAETGSGKTLAYVLPMLRHVLVQRPIKDGDGPIALILVPTRELACQIYQEIRYFTKLLKINVSCVYGGTNLSNQINELRRGVEIVVATPGRFIDILCLSNGKITNLRRVTYVVLDEADRMLDLGFEPQISKILSNVRPTRQTVMFSATFPRQIENLAKKILTKPIEVVVGTKGQSAKNIIQHVEIIPKSKSFIRLLELLDDYDGISTLIFVDNQDEGIELWKQLFKLGYSASLLHGGMDQGDRIDAIEKFKKDTVKIMISTSICARGLDIKQCGLVINFRCPNHMEDYIHRIGRTGRAGKTGIAYTFICPYEEDHLAEDIMYALELSGQEVPFELRELVRNYKKKLENGETDRHRISGYLGKGYQFNSNENMINCLERKLLGDGIMQESNMENFDNNQHEQDVKKLLELTNGESTNVTNALVLRKNYSNLFENKSNEENSFVKFKQLSHDVKAKQIAIETGMNTAKAAILSGKKEEEILPMVQDAIKKVLDNYKPGVSLKKGVENAIKIIEDWEYKENIKNHIYTCEFEINDYPTNARNRCYKKDFIKTINELNDVEVSVKGTYVEFGKKENIGQKKLYLLIKGKSQACVNNAYTDIKRQLDDIAFAYYTNTSGYTGNVQKYNV